MNLDGVLEGRFPGIQLIIARDATGKVQAFHRYATAGGGSDITSTSRGDAAAPPTGSTSDSAST